MSRILLAPFGSLGDLHPLIAIGLKLRERGHTVFFCASPCYRTKIETLGFEFQPLRPDISPEASGMSQWYKDMMDADHGPERFLRGFVFPQLRATYADLSRAVTSGAGIDLLVAGDIIYAAPLVAEKTGIRWVSCTASPISFFSACDPPVLPPFPKFSRLLRRLGRKPNRAVIQLIKLCTRAWSKPVRELRAELKLPRGKDPIYEGKFSPRLVLAMFSSVLAQTQPDWPPHTVITGFPFYDGKNGGTSRRLTEFLASGSPPLVFTLGSAAVFDPGNFYEESVRAAALLKRRAVLLVGRNPPPSPLPESVVALDYVPFSEIFPHAAAIVHQGGVGTTGQALRAGRPMLVMPYSHDQPDNAARVSRLGVARTISRKAYAAVRVAKEVDQLLANSDYERKAKAVSQHVNGEDGAAAAVDALETLLGSQKFACQ